MNNHDVLIAVCMIVAGVIVTPVLIRLDMRKGK